MRALPLCKGCFSQVSVRPRADCVQCDRRWPPAAHEAVLPHVPFMSTPEGQHCPMRVRVGVDFSLLPGALGNKAPVSPALGRVPGAGGTSSI